jgi:hypothetical protein
MTIEEFKKSLTQSSSPEEFSANLEKFLVFLRDHCLEKALDVLPTPNAFHFQRHRLFFAGNGATLQTIRMTRRVGFMSLEQWQARLETNAFDKFTPPGGFQNNVSGAFSPDLPYLQSLSLLLDKSLGQWEVQKDQPEYLLRVNIICEILKMELDSYSYRVFLVLSCWVFIRRVIAPAA